MKLGKQKSSKPQKERKQRTLPIPFLSGALCAVGGVLAAVGERRRQKEERQRKQKTRAVWLSILFGFLFVLGAALTALGIWYQLTFNLEFKELLYTLASPLKGTGQSTVWQIVGVLLPVAIVSALLFALVAWLLWRPKPILKHFRRVGCVICAGMLVFSIIFSLQAFRIPAYLKTLKAQTTVYEDWYVDPDSVSITANGKPKNLIYIYLESMETTYSSEDLGGNQWVNYMPLMTELAETYVSFSDKEAGKLGGFHTPSGTTWTIAALLATTAGIPFAFPLGEDGHNKMSQREIFAAGLTTLGDVLAEKGYRQEFLCGSNAAFAGRDLYFEQHGDYEIFDLYTARKEGYIPEDYYEWWGYEDEILYEIAKDELTELASGDQPFNFTMLTVDTHHVGGYVCELCERRYGSTTANVVSCADRQVYDFVGWCMEQDFFEDTVIIVTGDHPRMDSYLVGDVDYYDRTIYNCWINSAVEPTGQTTERIYTSMDVFPTTLAALGFSIEGERLGLGVNLFSDQATLSERLGYDWLNTELNKFSEYYIKEFS